MKFCNCLFSSVNGFKYSMKLFESSFILGTFNIKNALMICKFKILMVIFYWRKYKMIGGVYGHYMARDLRLGINFRVNRESCLLIGVITILWRHRHSHRRPSYRMCSATLDSFSILPYHYCSHYQRCRLIYFLSCRYYSEWRCTFYIPSGTAY